MARSISLRKAFDLHDQSRLAIVGAGGKTSLMFQLAKEFETGALVTTSTHLAAEQARLADYHYRIQNPKDIENLFLHKPQGITLITGDNTSDNRLAGLPLDWLEKAADLANQADMPILIEADGSKRLPLKAPADHEPAIPIWIREVVVCAGLNALGKPIDPDHIHRPERLLEITGERPGSQVTTDTVAKVLSSTDGGLKNIPTSSRKMVFLNQADSDLTAAAGGNIARQLYRVFDTVVVASLYEREEPVKACFTSSAAIILAAGKSNRLEGGQKVLLDWFGEPFIRHIAKTALLAQMDPVIIVAGSESQSVHEALSDLPVTIVENKDWASGQSSSIRTGLQNLPERVRSVVFLLGDQPQVTPTLIQALISTHHQTLAPIIAPIIEDRRANPVLFDRSTFPDLIALQGDTGGRAIFSKYPREYLPWLDSLILRDVDTQSDYHDLLASMKATYAS